MTALLIAVIVCTCASYAALASEWDPPEITGSAEWQIDYLPGEQKVAANGLSIKVNLDGYFIDSIGYNLDFGGRLDMLS